MLNNLLELHSQLHIDYGICGWTILAATVGVIMIVVGCVHGYKQHKREAKGE